MKNIVLLLSLFFVSFTLLECSKTEPDNENIALPQVLTAFQFQIIEFSAGEFTLNQGEYSATLGDSMVTVYRRTDTTLVTTIPMLPVGEYPLTITGLDGFSATVAVSETVLENTPEVIIGDLYTAMNAITFNIPDTSGNKAEMENAMVAFNTILENSTESEKHTFAVYYQANKEMFEKMLTLETGNSRKNSDLITNDLKYFAASIVAIGVGVWISSEIPVLGIPLFIAGIVKAKEYKSKIDVLEPIVSKIGLLTENNTKSEESDPRLSFINESGKTVLLAYSKRGFTSTDESVENPYISGFFNDLRSLNNIIDKINSAIMVANKLPFVNLNPIINLSVSENNSTIEYSLDEESYQNISFSLNTSEIAFSSVFIALGTIEMTLTANSTLDLTNPIEAVIQLNFSDELNNYSTTIPVELTKAYSLKEYLINGSTWDWRNYGEHALYSFSDGNVEISWEEQDSTGNFTGSYNTSAETWEIITESTFWISDDDEKIYYQITGKFENSFTANVCETPEFSDCSSEVFTSLD